MSAIVKLKQIADISMGQSFRGRLEADVHGDVRVIQMKDLRDGHRLAEGNLIRVDEPGINERNFVRQGDLVFRSRGQTNTAVMIERALEETVVAAPMYRIRARVEGVLPAYLLWYINLPATQAWLARHARGTAVKIVSRRAVAEIELVLPPLEVQHKIVDIAALVIEEQQLMAELAEWRQKYMNGILMQIASGSQ